MKTAAAVSLLLAPASGLTISASTTKEQALAHAKNLMSTRLSVNHLANKGTALSSGSIASSTAVAGTWFVYSESPTCPATGTPVYTEGYKMGVCNPTDGTSTAYSTWACTEDSANGAVVLSQTTYTDAACTTGASVQTPLSFSECTGTEHVQCPTSMPAVTDSYGDGLWVSSYATSSECNSGSGSILAYSGAAGCVDGVLYGEATLQLFLTPDCSGAAVYAFNYADLFPAGVCNVSTDDGDDDGDDSPISVAGQYYKAEYGEESDDDVCFHISSKIDYKGVEYTYEELKAGKEPECTVPHSPSSRGVIVSTSCGKTVRVTDTHLVATTKGFQLAYSLKAGDVLFGDYDKEKCVVQSVEKEKTTQQYFGLNCVHSEVLASGLRASTFGDFHTLPSWYMTYVGGLVGSEYASSLGEYVAEWYFKK